MKMGARSWLPSSSTVPYQQQRPQQQQSSPPAGHQSSSSASTPVKTHADRAAATTGTRSSSPSSPSSASSTPPPSPTGKKQHRHRIVAPVSHPISCHANPLFSIPVLGGAGVLVGSSGGLEKRLDGPAVALAAAAAAQQAERHLAVSRDLALNLPPCPALPDGEERPYGASTRLRIRDYDQESEIYRECIRPPPNRTVQQTTTAAALGRASLPPSNSPASPSPASLACCSAPGCCGSASSSSSGGGGGYRSHLSQRHGSHANHLRHRRKASHHLAPQEHTLDTKHPDGPLSARLEAPPPPSVMVPSGARSIVKSARGDDDGYWPETNSRSKLASLTVVSCSSASSSVDGGSPASSGRASPAKPADAHT